MEEKKYTDLSNADSLVIARQAALELLKIYGLDAENIAIKAKKAYGLKK